MRSNGDVCYGPPRALAREQQKRAKRNGSELGFYPNPLSNQILKTTPVFNKGKGKRGRLNKETPTVVMEKPRPPGREGFVHTN